MYHILSLLHDVFYHLYECFIACERVYILTEVAIQNTISKPAIGPDKRLCNFVFLRSGQIKESL